MGKKYWRCSHCGEVWTEGGPCVACILCGPKGKWDLVAVMPLAEAEALRAMRARLEDDALRLTIARETCGVYSGAGLSIIATYRDAVRGEGDGT